MVSLFLFCRHPFEALVTCIHERRKCAVRRCLLYILWRKLFPFSYDPHPWVKGRTETTTEVLKSVLAIYVFRKEVNWLKEIPDDPADFSCNLYQPELNANGSEYVHHRENHNHLLKGLLDVFRKVLFLELT